MAHPRKLRDKVTKEELIRLYWEENKTMKEIANIYGVSWSAVRKYMVELGIDRRDKYSTKWLISNKTVNENFFSDWSAPVAYALGIIVTDGCIDISSGDLQISMVDGDVVEKIAEAMELTNGIRKVKSRNGGKEQYKLSICRRKFVEDLAKLGVVVTGGKTYKQGALDIPKEYRSHFVRGFFDGDGSIVIRDRFSAKGTPVKSQDVTIVSASKDSLEGLAEILNEDLGLDISVKEYKGGTKGKYKTMYRINFSCRKKVGKFLRYIYKDKGNLYMERKYRKVMTEGAYLINNDTLS